MTSLFRNRSRIPTIRQARSVKHEGRLKYDMSITILHLSDIHIKSEHDPVLSRSRAIARSTFHHLPETSHLFIVVSGDIAFSGKDEQYIPAFVFLEDIRSAITEERDVPIDFVLIPGNHDCDFDRDNETRKILLEQLLNRDMPDIDESVINTCVSVQSAFFEFRKELCGELPIGSNKLGWTREFEVAGHRISFECLNLAWTSRLTEDPGRIFYPINDLYRGATNRNGLTVAVLHHPAHWLSQSVYRDFRQELRRLADVVITGHEHIGNVGTLDEAESDVSGFVEGWALQQDDMPGSSFNVIELDIEAEKFRANRYDWQGNRYERFEDEGWLRYHDLAIEEKQPFSITREFKELLDDPGAFFVNPERGTVTLDDIYVYPDLKLLATEGIQNSGTVSSKILEKVKHSQPDVIVQAEEKAGATCLLRKLFKRYHQAGFVPVMMNGADLRQADARSVETIIRKSVIRQYGVQSKMDFEQLERTKKILLFDNFELCGAKTGWLRAALISKLRSRFGRLLMVTDETFEMVQLVGKDGTDELATVRRYSLQPLGFRLRAELVKKWFSLDPHANVDRETFEERCEKAERVINETMTRSVIPAMPLYLLMLLQNLDSTSYAKESTLGHYYHSLLTQSFHTCGVRPEKMVEVFTYAGHLAWEYHSKGDKLYLSEVELRKFNEGFSNRWHSVDFGERMEILTNARVLNKRGDEYRFRYPYIFYYLKGQYMNERITDPEVRAYIERCCSHLYVRDYANTVLFLVHHTTDQFVVDAIAKACGRLFEESDPITFEDDTGKVKQLISAAPRFRYDGEDPDKHRERTNRLRDDLIGTDEDGLVEHEEGDESLSFLAQLTMLFKSGDILGQVLRTQYSRIERARKVELLELLFNGPLRALGSFYDGLSKEPDALLAETAAAIRRRGNLGSEERIRELARRITARVIQLVTFSFIVKAGRAGNAESLREDLREVVDKKGTVAFKLIGISTALDTPRPIPRQKLEDLYYEVKDDVVSGTILGLLLVHRLYMFRMSEQDKQWLSGKLDLDLGLQHAVSYNARRHRKLP